MENSVKKNWKELYYSVVGTPLTGDIYNIYGLSAFCLWLSRTDLKKIARDLYKDLRLNNILPYSYRDWDKLQDSEKSKQFDYVHLRAIASIYRGIGKVLPSKREKENLAAEKKLLDFFNRGTH